MINNNKMPSNKYILVTGAYGGMGRKTVERLSERGFLVFALDRSVGDAIPNVIPIKADITDESSVADAFRSVSAITNELFAVIHFAGIYMLDSLVEIKRDAFVGAFEVNLFGAFLVNSTFRPLLKAGSRIIITTSELAPLAPLPFTGIYAVTKGALDRYAYSLRMELQLLGISVSVLRAGAVDTGMLGASTAALERFCSDTKLYSCNAERFRKIVNGVEAKRIPPQKIAWKIDIILNKNRPKFAYSINRNPLLLMLNALPCRLQFRIIKKILNSRE